MDLDFQELQSPSLKELFVKQMESMILSGKLPIGAKLPTERELSEKMNVSRAVVNGGLSEMESKGFLQVIPRKGTYVADYKYTGKLDILKSIMEYNNADFEPEMLQSLVQVRKDIICTCFPMAALNRRDEDIEALETYLLGMEAPCDNADIAELSFRFEHEICIASGNVVYPLIYYSFKSMIISFSNKYLARTGNTGRDASLIVLRKIFESIRDQQPDEAREMAVQFINLGTTVLGYK